VERDKLMNDLRRAGQLSQESWIAHFHQILKGYNGGGDPYYTDGRLTVGVIALQRPLTAQSSNLITHPRPRA
jgi:hypothetical protein